MKLLTEEIKKALPALYSREKHDGEEARFVCKFFDPCGSWTWYVMEGDEREDRDWLFYGLVDGHEKEWGYFMLSELQSVKGPLGLGIERDIFFEDEKAAKYV